MIFSRAWFALMRRNLIYRKRYLGSTIFEFMTPFCFVWVIVAIKNSVDVDGGQTLKAFLPQDVHTLIPLSYEDYMQAIQAQRVCSRPRNSSDALMISGMVQGGYNWQVPFVRCDVRRCESLGQDAHPFCEYSILAVSGSSEDDDGGRRRAEEFQTYIYDRWPFLLKTREGTIVQEGRPFPFEFVKIFSDSKDMEAYLLRDDYGSVGVPKIGMGVVFDGDDPNHFKYWLRQNSTGMNAPESESETLPVVQTTPSTNKLFNDFARNDIDTCRRLPGDPNYGDFQDSCTGQYFYNGVIATQRLVGDFILNQTGAEAAGVFVADGGVGYVPFPSKEYVDLGFFGQFGDILPLLFTLGLLFPAASMIGYIVREKEHRQKELMKIMSVTESDIGWAWFSTFFLFHLLSMAVTAVISVVLFDDSDFSTLLLFWLLTILCVITFTMTMSSVTSKTSRAVLIGILVFLMGVVLTIAIDFRTAEPAVVRFVCFHPVTAFTYGVTVIGRLEDIGIGASFDSLDFTESNIRFSLKTTMKWLAFDSLLWGFLAYYLNRVIPQDYGQHLPLWFPLLPSYWFPSLRHANIEKVDAITEADSSGALVEEVGSALKKQTTLGQTIEIENLRKVYGEKIAIDDLTLTMYNGQITALLGQNGAGKTTTINVLTGVTAPTSGRASIVGRDIRSEVSAIRQDIGICFQHDCLFEKLTVREHIEFFARLKGLYARESRKEAERQIDQAILDVALSEKCKTLSCNLSGGMKRKLSVAIAFCGGSKVVLLDEPTSGMDPFSRRFTWDVIRSYRQDRIIILTTHFMDEADILGDRIAIMAEGKLRCAGSSLWLKKQYSVGYQLTIERSGSKLPRTNEVRNCVIDSDSTTDDGSVLLENAGVKRIVTDAIPQAKVITDVGAELSYKLPIGESSKFPSLFEQLDKQIERGVVSSYGVSITTLNAVFLAVTKGERAKQLSQRDITADSSRLVSSLRLDSSEKANMNADTSEDTSTSVPENREIQNSDIGFQTKVSEEAVIDSATDSLFFRHLGTLLKKRALYFRRDKKAWICTTIVPSIFVLIGLVVFVSFAASRDLSPLELDIQDYNAVLGNTIPFNTPDSPFRCQTGFCSYPQPYVQDQLTGELYVWCGFESRIGITQNSEGGYNYELSEDTCSILDSRDIMNSVVTDHVSTEEAGVRSISETSLYLDYFRDSYANSKYGAIWFTHDESSKINGGASYNETVNFQCELIRPSLTYSRDCRKFGGVGYVIQYNFTSLHAALMYEAIANEALVRFATGSPDFKVQTTIAPLPVTSLENGIGAGEDAFTVWFLIVFGFPFIAGAYASFVVTERKIGAKHLQTVAGVGTSAYWLSTFLWDVLNYQIPLWVTIGLMYLFKVDVLTTDVRNTFSGVITLLFLFGPASAGFAYCASFSFKSASMANICMIIIGFLIGMGGPLVCIILVLVARDPLNPRPELEAISGVLEWMLRIVPSFCLGNGLYTVINIEFFLFVENDKSLTAWSGPIMAYDIYFLAAECILYPILAIQFDRWSTNPHIMSVLHRFLRCATCTNTSIDRHTVSLPDDDDVLAEEEAVLSADDTDREKLIIIKELTKRYDTGKLAVDRLSLSIAPGECFGLLGINGAGKTTTMKMLTAEFPPTSGDAILAGFSVSRQPEKTRRKIGYCPQFDAHFAHLTGREHVELYASIKGIPVHLVAGAADEKLQEVGLSTFDSNRLAAGYSGGMKRRLSLACATVGRPQIIFLDECSTGVDPVAREEIWMMVSEIVMGRGLPAAKKPSVILTTHSMEECEALCPRIGIMANGRLRCLGSAQRLKSKFGQGFQIEMKVKFVDCDDEDFVESTDCLKWFGEGASKELFNLQECKDALDHLTGTPVLSEMVSENSSSPGYSVWKEASSLVGVSLEDLALFATTELRMLKLESFISDNFPEYVLRERQDTKARYEVSGSDVRISRIFASIEENKDELRLSDYSASQTSLEQVFNMHAAEAERHKQRHGEQ